MNTDRRKFVCSLLVAAGTGAGFYWGNRWEYIVIHHSAGAFGDIEHLQKVHRERQGHDPIDAIPYHYVIGNGNGLNSGEVARDWRGQLNIWGAHVSKYNNERNKKGIGICLIGNYEHRRIPEKQYQALVSLTRKLMGEHQIKPGNVTGHGYLPGENTKCPGKHFPMFRFMRDIT